MRELCKLAASLLIAYAALPSTAQDVHVTVSPSSHGNKNSTDDFPTIQMALDHAPEPGPGARLYLHVQPGTYSERVYVSQLRPRTTLLGAGSDPSQVVITAAQNAGKAGGTFFTETAEILGEDFEADNITFDNSAGNTGQAVAISVTADRAIFKKCRFIGDQDTLFANYGRHYYVDSYISGGVDFIFGNATAVFENSEIHIIRPGYLTAQSRTASTQTTGFVIRNCRVTSADFGDKTFFLGRPWRQYSRVIYVNTQLPANLDPKGWDDWGRNPKDTLYAEYGSTGPGARVSSRLPWSHQLSEQELRQYPPKVFLAGTDQWDPVSEAARLP